MKISPSVNIVVFGLWHEEVSLKISTSVRLTGGLISAPTAANIFFYSGNLPRLNKGNDARRDINNTAWCCGVARLGICVQQSDCMCHCQGLLMINDREVIIPLNPTAKPPCFYKHSHAWKTFKDICDFLGTWSCSTKLNGQKCAPKETRELPETPRL